MPILRLTYGPAAENAIATSNVPIRSMLNMGKIPWPNPTAEFEFPLMALRTYGLYDDVSGNRSSSRPVEGICLCTEIRYQGAYGSLELTRDIGALN